MSAKQEIATLLKNATPQQLITSEVVGERFQNMYQLIHGIKDKNKAAAFYQAEQFHFLKLINDNTNIAECTKLSLYGVFMDVSVSGLSFDPSMKHMYIVPKSINRGTKEAPKWEKVAQLRIDGRGELLLRVMQGQVKHVDNPVIVYEGDEFRYGSSGGKTVLDHIACIPRKTDKPVACYLKITRTDDTIDYKVMTYEDLMDIKKFSDSPNGTAWTKGEKGMFRNKVIKHAFNTYPKVRVGEFSKLNTEDPEEVEEIAPIDYGFGIDMEVPEQPQQPQTTFTPHEEVKQPAAPQPTAQPQQPQPPANNFATPAPAPATVKYDPDEAF